MDPAALTDEDLVVLAGLVRVLLHTDDLISAEEQDLLCAWQAAVGHARWNAAVVKARGTLSTPGAPERAARSFHGAAALLAGDLLASLARCDEMMPVERRWLDDLRAHWVTDGN